MEAALTNTQVTHEWKGRMKYLEKFQHGLKLPPAGRIRWIAVVVLDGLR